MRERMWSMALPDCPVETAVAEGVESFLALWYGPPKHAVVVPEGSAPHALRSWWAFEKAWERALTVQNHVLGPDRLFEERGLTVFYVENQSVVLWGYAVGDDPAVSERSNDSSSDWIALGLRLSDFLLHVAVFEASFGPHGLVDNDCTADRVRGLLVGFSKLPLLAFWPGCTFHARGDLLASVTVNQPPDDPITEATTWMVMFASPTSAGLAAVDDRAPEIWDYDSRRDG
jgi:hypothetical protein